MEIRVCIGCLVVLMLVTTGLRTAHPRAVVPGPQRAALSAVEQRVADAPHDSAAVAQLAALYLEAKRPGLAIALLRGREPAQLTDPRLSHQLARAYEQSRRMDDALATAELALGRCARALGTRHRDVIDDQPVLRCDERTLASLERHRNALGHMVQWGVQGPHDPRASVAYRLAERRVSLAQLTH